MGNTYSASLKIKDSVSKQMLFALAILLSDAQVVVKSMCLAKLICPDVVHI